jgi:hypothetical protein
MNTEFANYVIVAWVVLAVTAFTLVSPRRGVLVILLSGMLFLPSSTVGGIEIGPIKFTKSNAVCYALLLVCLLYDADRLFSLTPSWADLPALVWCACPAVSALLNDPPPDGSGALRDAASQVFAQTTLYLIPYWIGRAYFSDPEGMRELVVGTIVAGLVYVPFCLYEVRMSPQLHATVYGYLPHSFGQQVRFGGYRPMVFLGHGLAVAMFMAMTTVLAAWIHGTDSAGGRWRKFAVWVLGPTLVLCKSVGPTVLAGVGVGLMWLTRLTSKRIGLFVLLAIPPAYCVVRLTGVWDGNELVQISAESVDEDRSQSLGFRFEQENLLISRALDRPVFGWGGWGRNRVKDQDGKDMSVTDGLWIIYMGSYGIVGLMAYGAMVLLPVVRYARLLPATSWTSSKYAAANGCAAVVGLWCVDSLLNALSLPLFFVMAGGLTRMNLEDGTSEVTELPPCSSIV